MKGPSPPRQQLANVGGVEQLLGPQQHPVPHLEHRVDAASVELRLALLLRHRQELAHSPGVARRCLVRGAVGGRGGQRQAPVRPPVDEEGREPVAQDGGRIVDGEHGERQLSVPVVLAPVREGAQRVPDDAVGALDLGVGVLVVRRADDEAGAPWRRPETRRS